MNSANTNLITVNDQFMAQLPWLSKFQTENIKYIIQTIEKPESPYGLRLFPLYQRYALNVGCLREHIYRLHDGNIIAMAA